jgi:hypothetical protein
MPDGASTNIYFAELNRRFEGGFDPGLSISPTHKN